MGKIFAINDLRRGLAPGGRARARQRPRAPGQDRLDTLARPLRDLRISVTDRCNFRCSYCMPKEVFDNQHVFLPQSALLSFEEITRLARLFARRRRAQAAPDRRRAAAAQEPRAPGRDAGRAAHARRRAARPHAHHQRLAARAQGRGAEGRGPEARHRQPGRDRRRRVPPHERRRLRGGGRARAASTPRSPPASRRSRSTWSSRRARNDDQIVPLDARAAGALRPRRRAALHRVHGRRLAPTAGAWTTCCPRATCSRACARSARSAPLPASAEGETAQRWRFDATGQEIGLVSSVTAGLLRQLQPRAAVHRRPAVPVPVRHPRPRPARAAARRRRRRRDRRRHRPPLGRPRRPLLRAAHRRHARARRGRRTADERRVEMHYIGG